MNPRIEAFMNGVSDRVQTVRRYGRKATRFVEGQIEDRPLTVLAVALGLGWLIGRLTRRPRTSEDE